ncbi:MobA/MobL family protein, partial [Anaerovibrio lipolyticus]|uniref:MobA/MobL family protein n=1 Tax=Anaerovibrio lipolyticus TaxID=82374 RepID=UPI0009DD7AF0
DINTLLYKSSFGELYISPKGIQVTDNASIQTILMALEVAKETFSGNLILKGNQNFIGKAIIAASNSDSKLTFDDKNIQNLYQKETEKNGEYIRTGESGREYRFTNFNSIFQQYPESGEATIFSEPLFTSGRNALSILPSWDMDDSGLRADLPMPGKLFKTGLQVKAENDSSGVRHILPIEATRKRRFIVPDYRKQQLKEAAKRLIYRIDNELDEDSAISHLEYINRENAFKKRGGCLYTDHHLPEWSLDDPHIFFTELSKNERKNANEYKEIELNLPNELTFDQQMECINEFLDMHFKNHYYTFAVHQKIGSLSEGELHPHVHIMFCEREIDDIEREHERPPEQFFKRYNPKHPEKGGCRKPEKWNGKHYIRSKHLKKIRKDFADIQNRLLEKYSHEVRVDERTLEVQRLEALKNGDYEKAEILNRPAEKTIPLAKAMNENSPEVKALKKFRQNRKAIQRNHSTKKYLKNKSDLDSLNQIINDAIADYNDYNISDDLSDIADELKKYKELLTENRTDITDFIMQKSDPETAAAWNKIKKLADNKKVNNEIINDIDFINLHDVAIKDNKKIDKKIAELAKTVRPFFQKQNSLNHFTALNKSNSKLLESKNKILVLKKKLHERTQNDSLLAANEAVNKNKSFSIDELIHFMSMKLEQKNQEISDSTAQNEEYAKAKINEKRAYVMAQNKYTKGLLKKINTSIREQKKLLDKIENLKEKRNNTLVHADQMKLDNAIKQMENTYRERNSAIEKDKITFKNMTSTDAAKLKINDITLGIIRANKRQLQKLQDNLKNKLPELEKEKSSLVIQEHKLRSLKEQYTKSKFALTEPNHPHFSGYPPLERNERGIIDALCGDPVAAALTMHIEEEHKDWRFLSVFERDRLMNEL